MRKQQILVELELSEHDKTNPLKWNWHELLDLHPDSAVQAREVKLKGKK